jgi:hypothetical protein
MGSPFANLAPTLSPGVGFLSNGGAGGYLIEAESTTGFIAWKTANGTTLVSEAKQVSHKATPSLIFWSCAGYQDTNPAGHITALDCHGNQPERG